jgi:hypothetical protein
MNLELEQQRKFIEQFSELVKEASEKFKEKWDNKIEFTNPNHNGYIPTFSGGVINMLSVSLRDKYETLRSRYYAKSL